MSADQKLLRWINFHLQDAASPEVSKLNDFKVKKPKSNTKCVQDGVAYTPLMKHTLINFPNITPTDPIKRAVYLFHSIAFFSKHWLEEDDIRYVSSLNNY